MNDPSFLRNLKITTISCLAAAVLFEVGYEGFRSDGFSVEHSFRQEGKSMLVLKNDRSFFPNYWVQGVSNMIQTNKGTYIHWINPREEITPRIYNFKGKSDAGEEISVGNYGFSVRKSKK